MSDRRARDEGRLRLHAHFPTSYLSTPRDVIVYLPPGYDAAVDRYPVFYLQDGQNLFDPATAFGGQDWRADVTADELILSGALPPVLMVGVYPADQLWRAWIAVATLCAMSGVGLGLSVRPGLGALTTIALTGAMIAIVVGASLGIGPGGSVAGCAMLGIAAWIGI